MIPPLANAATWAIGDVQGCLEPLLRLVARLELRPGDRVWLVGDLVNRGPDSLGVLRWAMAQGDRVTAVLGNHDLHLLARAAGVRGPGKRDTLDEVLAAPDRTTLLTWLRHRPLLHRVNGRLLLHAGLHPHWSVVEATARAARAEAWLRGDRCGDLLTALQPGARPDDALAEAVETVAWLTRVRTCTLAGELCKDYAGPPDSAPNGQLPWFDVPGRASAGTTVVCGHWAALGLHLGQDVIALDTGCVWGLRLTAVRLEDRTVVAVDAGMAGVNDE